MTYIHHLLSVNCEKSSNMHKTDTDISVFIIASSIFPLFFLHIISMWFMRKKRNACIYRKLCVFRSTVRLVMNSGKVKIHISGTSRDIEMKQKLCYGESVYVFLQTLTRYLRQGSLRVPGALKRGPWGIFFL